MQTISRRNLLSLSACAAVAASTGAALALPAPSALDGLIAAHAAAKAEYERVQSLYGDKEEAFFDWVGNLPESERYFTTNAYAEVRTGEKFILQIDMTKGLEHGLDRINAQHSDYASGFFCLEPAQSPEFQAAADRFFSERPAHFAKLEAIKAEVRPVFTATFEAIGKQMAALDYSAEEEAAGLAVEIEADARMAVLEYRPVNNAERDIKGTWLRSEFGRQTFMLSEDEQSALLTSLYPAHA